MPEEDLLRRSRKGTIAIDDDRAIVERVIATYGGAGDDRAGGGTRNSRQLGQRVRNQAIVDCCVAEYISRNGPLGKHEEIVSASGTLDALENGSAQALVVSAIVRA